MAASPAGVEQPSTSMAQQLWELTTRAATSWIGSVTAYLVALAAAVVAYNKLSRSVAENAAMDHCASGLFTICINAGLSYDPGAN
jgi:TRAP-type mannitol/chloroaromatic compound transport system permease small subunit